MADAPTGQDWSDQEVDLIVADYFDMLREEIAGRPYVKAHHNAALQSITGRSHRSIEFKHQNISAVLVKLGLPWIFGYKPKAHYQSALVDGVERYISHDPEQILIAQFSKPCGSDALNEDPALLIEQAPLMLVEDSNDPPALSRLVSKFDPAARDARNRVLGRQGEEFAFSFERMRLTLAGRDDLARKVRWVAEDDGDGAGYDIASFHPDGRERLLEVKTTVGQARTPFFLTENERLFSEERPDAFRILRLYDFAMSRRGFELAPPLSNSVVLSPATYRASFGS
jgi:hypothetical protein